MRMFLLALSLVPVLGTPIAQAADFRLEEYFLGRTHATGSFSAINGVKRTFTVALHGRWNGKTLTLREDFVYDDGERDTKTWRFTKTGPTTYSGTREDVIGTTTVRLDGNRARFTYKVDLEPGEETNVVRFFDTLILSDDGKTVKNTANVFKGPLPVARVRVDFTR